jgi:hypothetical protein
VCVDCRKCQPCVVVGPRAESGKIPGIDVAVGENDEVNVGGFTAKVGGLHKYKLKCSRPITRERPVTTLGRYIT